VKIHPNKSAQSHIPASHGGKYGTKNPDANVIDFSSNVNPLGCHPGVKRYLKKQLNLEMNLYTILQILSVTAFEKVTLLELLTEVRHKKEDSGCCKQLMLF
jgi:histidinol-phosphate/aromatic aminotransferase/cobyric acid decarboxylase-like protein